MTDLNGRLLAAHADGDADALIGLYTQAADTAATDGATAFYLTHALVFALERGDRRATGLRARLVAMGCDLPD